MNEKEILKSIKESVESETPNVWDKIRTSDSTKYDYGVKLKNSKSYMIRRISLAAACVLLVVVTLDTGILRQLRSSENPARDNLVQNPGYSDNKSGAPELGTGAKGDAAAPDIAMNFTKNASPDEASRAMGVEILTPTWLPQGFKLVSSTLFGYDKNVSEPYMYQMEYRSESGDILTIGAAKINAEDSVITPDSIPYDRGAKAAKPADEKEKMKIAEPATEERSVSPIPPDAPVQSSPGSTPSGMDVAPVAPSGNGSSQGTSGSKAGVNVDFVTVDIKGVKVNMSIISSERKGVMSANWSNDKCFYSISTNGLSKEDMTKILESMIK